MVLAIFVLLIFVLSIHFTHVALRKRPFHLENVPQNKKNEIKLKQNIPTIWYNFYKYLSYPLGQSEDIQCCSLASDVKLSGSSPLQHRKEFFNCSEHIGVAFNMDSVALFKSSRVTMWPVYLEIVNFPPSVRFRTENTVICGLSVGRNKPDMKILLRHTLEAIERLHVIGLDFVNSEGLKKSIRLQLLCGVFDFVAKAKWYNLMVPMVVQLVHIQQYIEITAICIFLVQHTLYVLYRVLKQHKRKAMRQVQL